MKVKTLDGLVKVLLHKIKQGYSCRSAYRALNQVYGRKGMERLRDAIRNELSLQLNEIETNQSR
jgi:hypothetical protein